MLRTVVVIALLALPAAGEVSKPTVNAGRYPVDLSWRLLTETEIERVTGSTQGLGRMEESAPPLWSPPVIPMSEIPVAADKGRLVRPPATWTVPPFDEVPPELPADLPPEVRAQRVAAETPGPRPDGYADVPVYTSLPPSAQLRPRPALAEELIRPRDGELPPPFSLRRYHTDDIGFVQVAVYGGTTSFRAEQIYHSLRLAASQREELQGIGQMAFMSRIPAPETPKPPAEEPAPEPEPARSDVPFGEVAPEGAARPDMLDAPVVAAQQAPSFQSIPVDLKPAAQEPTPEAKPDAPKPEAAAPAPKPQMLMLVAYFPERALVLELAMDERIGDTQALLNLALMSQSRLVRIWGDKR